MNQTTQENKNFKYTCYVGKFEKVIDVNEGETTRGSVLKRWPSPPEDPTSAQWMRLEETSSVYAMWSHEEEDIYTEEDGTPL